MSNAPITVSGRALPEAVIKNIVRGPIVKPNLDNALSPTLDNTLSLGFNQSVYKVKLVANGRTFNMLLPPSIESKHPGRSNPLQLPGLQIESMSNISKLKIPGFFPIYQHLGVESLYISMSGMFTGYDGEDQISTAGDWEGWANPEVKGGQDAYTAACDLFDFAVKNKALTTVTISTSDGSFDPKKSTSTNFRDEQSNIRFKGYIKELKQIYIRQDRVYYMLKFEIIDLGNSNKECAPSKKLIDNKLLTDTAARGLNDLNTPISEELLKVIKDQYDKLSPRDKNIILSNLILSKILPANYNSTDITKAIASVGQINGTSDINKIIDILNLSANNANLNRINPLSASLKRIQEGLKVGSNSFFNGLNTIRQSSNNFLNRTINQIKEDTNDLIFEARSAALIPIAKAEQLKTLNEIAASKNEKNIVDYINKSLSTIKIYSNNSINQAIAKDLIDQEISNTINNIVIQPSIKQGLQSLKNTSSAFDITRNTQINNLLNLGNINNSDFTDIPEPDVKLRYETLLERVERFGGNVLPNTGINIDRFKQTENNPVKNSDDIEYIGTSKEGFLVFDVKRDNQFFGTYITTKDSQLIKVSQDFKNTLPLPTPEIAPIIQSPTIPGLVFTRNQTFNTNLGSILNEYKQINIDNPLRSTDSFNKVGQLTDNNSLLGFSEVYNVTRNGKSLGFFTVGRDKSLNNSIRKIQ